MQTETYYLTADEHDTAYRQAAYELLQQYGWSHRISSLEQFTALVNASACNFIALKDGQVIGYIRAITDGLSNGYISMLVVDPAYRKHAIWYRRSSIARPVQPGCCVQVVKAQPISLRNWALTYRLWQWNETARHKFSRFKPLIRDDACAGCL